MGTETLPRTGFYSHRAHRGDELNLCHGRPLFPPAHAGFNAFNYSKSGTFLNGSTSHALFRAHMGASYTFSAGMCGPAWAGLMIFTPKIEKNALTLDVEEPPAYLGVRTDAVSAGLTYGVFMTFRLGVRVDIKHPYVHCHHWGCSAGFHWGRVFNFHHNVTFDFIAILYKIASYKPRPDTPPKATVGAHIPGLTESYNIVDVGRFDPNDDLEPKYSVRVNLINYIPYVGEFNHAASAYGSSVELGPSFSIVFPTSFRVTHFGYRKSGETQKLFTVDRNRSKEALSGTATTSNPFGTIPNGEAAVRVAWDMHVTLGLGVYGKVTLLWVLSQGFNVTFRADKLSHNLRLGAGSYHAHLFSHMGKTNAWDAVAGVSDRRTDPLADLTPDEAPTFTFAAPEAVTS